MKALVLAAGRGTRLGGLTEQVPKPLIEVAGKPVLQHHIESLAAAGVTEICINTHHLSERIMSFVGRGERFGVQVHYSMEPVLLGTAGALWNFREQLGAAPFFVVYGDNFVRPDYRAIHAFHNSHGGIAAIALHYREDVSMSGIAVLDETDRIQRFIEKPKPEEQISHWVNAGIYVLEPRIFSFLPHGESDFGKNIFPELLRGGESLFGCKLEEDVLPIDTPELLEKARGGAA